MAYPKHNDMRLKCNKCSGGHRVENRGIRCSFCNGMGLRVVEQDESIDARNRTKEAVPDFGARSKILLHFMKGWISLTPMETIMKIPGKLEYLERLVKLARRRKDEKVGKN